IQFSDIKQSLYNILCQMEPFGPENLRPVFVARNVVDTGWSKIVKEEHLRVSLKQNNAVLTGIGFWMADKYELLKQQKPVDVVFKIEENEWNDQKSLQLKIIDLRISAI
ncbi:MAG TPA: single-stranded-DNA-specific exonuclease RecJ, partial [Chitinophagaceae bacterium]|nr:single-stranded-DNA-specific exonuclease RecJ [Chitinophagaceae bacterium]